MSKVVKVGIKSKNIPIGYQELAVIQAQRTFSCGMMAVWHTKQNEEIEFFSTVSARSSMTLNHWTFCLQMFKFLAKSVRMCLQRWAFFSHLLELLVPYTNLYSYYFFAFLLEHPYYKPPKNRSWLKDFGPSYGIYSWSSKPYSTHQNKCVWKSMTLSLLWNEL